MYERQAGDDLCSKDKRLKYKWVWTRIACQIPADEIKKWTHFQCSHANIGRWTLESVQWASDYEVRVDYNDETVVSKGGFKSRIDAQIGGEKLLVAWITEQYKEIVGIG